MVSHRCGNLATQPGLVCRHNSLRSVTNSDQQWPTVAGRDQYTSIITTKNDAHLSAHGRTIISLIFMEMITSTKRHACGCICTHVGICANVHIQEIYVCVYLCQRMSNIIGRHEQKISHYSQYIETIGDYNERATPVRECILPSGSFEYLAAICSYDEQRNKGALVAPWWHAVSGPVHTPGLPRSKCSPLHLASGVFCSLEGSQPTIMNLSWLPVKNPW